MNPDLDQLNETFAAHESLAPDADSVLAKSHEIARNLKRRQWAVRATGGAVLGAGLVVGGIAIPGALHHSGHNATLIQPADGGLGTPTASPSPATTYTEGQELNAYFNAGYDYGDAQQLAQIWNEPANTDMGMVKAEAGGKLLAGDTLPVQPSGTPATPDEIALQSYFNAGYTYDDAVQLATIWHTTDAYHAKIEGGEKLENGDKLPVAPSGKADPGGTSTVIGSQEPPASLQDGAAVTAFFAAGYTYDDAVQLAQTWNTADPYHAKIEGGELIEKGKTLPIPPSGTPGSTTDTTTGASLTGS
jgi:hypothetical protein